jgi:hypothetical protein
LRKLLFLLLLFVSPVAAQTVVPIVGGNATINMAQPNAGNAFKIFVTGSVTVNVSGQPTSNSSFMSILFAQDGTGHTVTFGGAFGSSAPTIPTTASSTTTVSFQYDGTSNLWNWSGIPVSSPTTTNVAPNQNVTYVSPNCGTQTNCYPVHGDTQFVTDATWSNSATPVAITCSNSDCNFTSADTGKKCFGITSGVANAPLGTFTYTSAQAGTCSGTSTGAASANGTFAWGTDDTGDVRAAWTAFLAAKCGAFVLPQAKMLVSGAIGDQDLPASCSVSSTFAGEWGGADIFGQGHNATMLVASPGFDFSAASAAGVFFSPAAGGDSTIRFHNLAITGLGQTLSGVSTSPAGSLVFLNGNGIAEHLWLTGWGGSATNSPNGIQINGQGDYGMDLVVDAFGTTPIDVTGGGVEFFNSFAGDSVGSALTVGQTTFSYGSAWGPTTAGSAAVQVGAATISEYGDFYLQSGAGAYGIQINDPAAVANLNGVTMSQGVTPNTNNYGVVMSAAGKVYATNSHLKGGATNGWIVGSVGGFYDNCGNDFTGAYNYTGGYFGSCSITGTAQTTGNVSLTSGWDTSTVSAASGNSLREQFTISLAGSPGSSNVVTVTYPRAFNVAPLCTLIDVGGTGVLPTSIKNGTIGTTTAAFTIGGTFTTGTEIFQLTCSN